jgi:GNAT superfamily N-acetyltransferase
MGIIDLQPEHHASYFNCLEEWSGDMREAGGHKACWFSNYEKRGLRVKLYLDDDDKVAGMIQYLPIEESFVEGKGLYFILCIWVHGHKEGIGNRQGRGIGTALLAAAEQDARERGAQGMAAWGLWLPIWMKASWFRKHGYTNAERDGISLLVWKPFAGCDAAPPRWVTQKKEVPTLPGKVKVTAFINGWCPAQNSVFERTRRVCAEFGDKVIFEAIDTSERATFREWGIVDGIFIDGKRLSFGPPLSLEKIRARIAKRVKRVSAE